MNWGKTFATLMIISLFIFSMAVALSEGDVEPGNTQVEEASTEEVVQEPISEDVTLKEQTETPIGEELYINLEELVETTNNTQKKENTNNTEQTEKQEDDTANETPTNNTTENNNTKTYENNETDQTTTNNTNEDLGIGEEDVEYINIEEVTQEKETVKEETTPEIIHKTLVRDGKVELEFKHLEGEDIDITKKELKVSETQTKIIVSSKEHFNDELTAYVDLPQEATEEQISIIWENEGTTITQGIAYYDTNGNGLFDRASFPIEHLSTQTYSIHISVDDVGLSSVLELDVISPPNGWTNITNPIEFEVNLNYSNAGDVLCQLEINNSGSYIFVELNSDGSGEQSLGEGQTNWTIYCEDTSDNSKNSIKSGWFAVVDAFQLNMDNNFFLTNAQAIGEVITNGGVVGLKLTKPSNTVVTLNNKSGKFVDVTIPANNLNEVGTYTLEATSYHYAVPATLQKTFDVGRITMNYDATAKEDEDVDFEIQTENVPSMFYDLYVGGLRIKKSGFISESENGDTVTKSFNYGNYTIELKNLLIDGTNYPDMNFGFLEVTKESTDTDDPDIDLDFPGWEEIVESSDITFKYSVSDNKGLLNCSLRIYNTTKSSSGVYETGDLIFPLSTADKNLATETSLDKVENIELRLVDFDDGEYIWDVECYDNTKNRGWNFNYFEVDTGHISSGKTSITSNNARNYTRESEVKGLISDINKFLEKEPRLGPEEQTVIKAIGLYDIMNLHKKRLLQLDQDIKYNMDFMTDQKRTERMKEINQEIDDIKKDIVSDINVLASHEYTKNSPSVPLKELIERYLDAANINMGSKALKSLVNFNEELQKDLSSMTNVWKVNIEYVYEPTEEIILVQKQLDIKHGFSGEIVEFLPETFSEATFFHPVKPLGTGVYELYTNDLEEDTITYYLTGNLKPNDLEQSETIIYKEGSTKTTFSINGMFTGAGELGLSTLSWIIAILFIGYIGFIGVWKFKLEQWKKEPGVNKMLELVEDAQRKLKVNAVQEARNNYSKMKEIYKALPPRCQQFFYKELANIHLAINKKDVINLVKEYEKARDEYRKEDALTIYNKINEVYRELPKKFQDKIYNRIVKKEVRS